MGISTDSRSPRGERGLKCHILYVGYGRGWSLPSRGAWIEIASAGGIFTPFSSLPSRGAWIEIGLFTRLLSPMFVAPLAGSVD